MREFSRYGKSRQLPWRRASTIRPGLCLVALAISMAALSILPGCGKTGSLGTIPIRGKVLFNGEALTQGEIRYLPKNNQGRVARGKFESDGGFVLTTLKDGDGALPDEYDVVILAPAIESEEDAKARRLGENAKKKSKKTFGEGEGPKSLVPLKYTSPKTSGLQDTVNSKHAGYVEFVLKE